MCIPHGGGGRKDNGYIMEDKPKKHIKRVSQKQFEKGDPDFIDERILQNEMTQDKKSLCDRIFGK